MRVLKSISIDLILITIATVVSLILRDNLEISQARLILIAPYLGFTLLSAAILLPASGVSRTMWRFGGMTEYRKLILVCVGIVLSTVALCFAANRLDNVMRSLPFIQLVLMAMLLTGVRIAERSHRFRHRGKTPQGSLAEKPEQILVVGLNSVAELFIQLVAEHRADKMQIAGLIGRKERQTGQLFRSHEVLGLPEELESVIADLEVHGVAVDRIVVTVAFQQLSEEAREALLRVENGSQIKVDYFAERIGFAERPPAPAAALAPQTSTVSSESALRPSEASSQRIIASLRRPYWKAKRLMDFVVASILIVLLAPVMVLVALVTAVTIGSPVLFWQQRPGHGGSTFKLYKFRTLLGAHDESGHRIPDPERETHFGRFLRATRLDELPQLFHILAGHMSFVGPRPLLDADQLDEFRDRLTVRPGLTGWAQVNGGRIVSAEDKMALDLWYIQHATFVLDLKIAFKTIGMILRREEKQDQSAVDQARLELMAQR